MMTGLIFHPVAVPIGVASILLLTVIWFWPTLETKPLYDPDRSRTLPENAPLMEVAP
jgi:hypothetical protein